MSESYRVGRNQASWRDEPQSPERGMSNNMDATDVIITTLNELLWKSKANEAKLREALEELLEAYTQEEIGEAEYKAKRVLEETAK